jgi:hypothetical protein
VFKEIRDHYSVKGHGQEGEVSALQEGTKEDHGSRILFDKVKVKDG